MDNIKDLLERLTLREKATLLCGCNPMYTHSVDRLGIPSLEFSDGPHGVRKLKKDGDSLGGIGNSLPTTCFPTAATSACSFNTENLRAMGEALAEECLYYGINVLLGPAINIQRNLYCGRNFEYFSEDPFLAGELGASQVKGIQSKGVGTSVKHFACNNNEQFRMYGDSVVDERALREIYLRPFEKVVKEAEPTTLMCAYNKVNGTFCSENKYLLQNILRDEWGFDGLVMSDWGAVKDRDKGVDAGLDLEMPGSIEHNVNRIVEAVNSGTLSLKRVNQATYNVLHLIEKVKKDNKSIECDFEKHDRLSLKTAKDSAVLLKNEDDILPLNKNEKYLVIGDFFVNMRYQGSGSSLINPRKLTTPQQAFNSRNINYEFVRGYKSSEIKINETCESEAIARAAEYDKIIFFGGQSDYIESEGFDRENMMLAENQISLIEKLASMKKDMIFVMFGGSPIEMPFERSFKGILNMMLPGQAGGEATASILFGETNPSGKLAQTWPLTHKDVNEIKKLSEREISLYKDSIYVGYRYYQSKGLDVRYPFGFGLSYSKFEYKNLAVDKSDGEIKVSLSVLNRSKINGKDIVQVYVQGPKGGIDKPLRELVGFKKVSVDAGKSAKVNISIPLDELRHYDAAQKKWILEKGEYTIEVGKNSQEINLKQKIAIESSDSVKNSELNKVKKYLDMTDKEFASTIGYSRPLKYVYKKRKYTLETPMNKFETFGGKLLLKISLGKMKKDVKRAEKMPEGTKKEAAKKSAIFLMRMLPYNSLRSACYSAGGIITYNQALSLLEIANGHILRGLAKLIFKRH